MSWWTGYFPGGWFYVKLKLLVVTCKYKMSIKLPSQCKRQGTEQFDKMEQSMNFDYLYANLTCEHYHKIFNVH